MNGIPDVLKGSYYANPTVDHPKVSEQAKLEHPLVPAIVHYVSRAQADYTWPSSEVYGVNIWPAADEKSIEGFEDAFKALGRQVLILSSFKKAAKG